MVQPRRRQARPREPRLEASFEGYWEVLREGNQDRLGGKGGLKFDKRDLEMRVIMQRVAREEELKRWKVGIPEAGD